MCRLRRAARLDSRSRWVLLSALILSAQSSRIQSASVPTARIGALRSWAATCTKLLRSLLATSSRATVPLQLLVEVVQGAFGGQAVGNLLREMPVRRLQFGGALADQVLQVVLMLA